MLVIFATRLPVVAQPAGTNSTDEAGQEVARELSAVAKGMVRINVLVTSKWSHFDRRQLQRHAIGSCKVLLRSDQKVELLFFMGDLEDDPGAQEAADNEASEFGDLVVIGGPNSDPPVPRDATYVLDRPAARTYRLAHGTAWLVKHRPELDYIMYLDDDSFIQLPRLFDQLRVYNSASLALGFLMETDLDWSDMHVCNLCEPCEPCRRERALTEFCGLFPEMALGGCMMAVQQCMIFSEGISEYECVNEKLTGIQRLASYFGSKAAPRWMLGMGWVAGLPFMAKSCSLRGT